MPEIAVHTFNSHGVQEMSKKLVVKRPCKRRVGCSPEPPVAVSEQNSLIEAMSADTAHSFER